MPGLADFFHHHANLPFLKTFLHSQLFVTPHLPTASLAGQTYIVVGASAGLGLEAARHLVSLGSARVILAVRNASKGDAALRSIEQSTGHVGVAQVWMLDLASYESVRQFAHRVDSELDRLDGVLMNAAVLPPMFRRVEGEEESVVVNVTSTFLLALMLLPKLKETARRYNIQPRLTVVSSEIHYLARFSERESEAVFTALNDERRAHMQDRYGTTKLIEILVVRELANLLSGNVTNGTTDNNPSPDKQSPPVIVNTLNPGFCVSEILRDQPRPVRALVNLLRAFLARTTEVGSRTLVAGLLVGEESHGRYMSDGRVAETSTYVRSAQGLRDGKRVWTELLAKLEAIEPGVSKNLSS